MAKMPMARNPKTGKMQPTFSMDGKGKMAKGGAVKPMAKGGAVKQMAKGGSLKMRKGKLVTKGAPVKMARATNKKKIDGIAQRGRTRAS